MDGAHRRSAAVLGRLDEAPVTTLPVLTDAFHPLTRNRPGAQRLMDFVDDSGPIVWSIDDRGLARAFELMRRYANAPMDFADATLVAAAETLSARKVFTVDRKDFAAYRLRRDHRHLSFEVVGQASRAPSAPFPKDVAAG